MLNQTFRDFEVIFLDDASTDNSLEVFQQYANHSQIRTVLNVCNSGSTFRQWNKGLREARGEYVWLAESDDFADPRFLERLVPVLEAHPAVGLVYCQSSVVDEDDNLLYVNEDWTADLDPNRWRHDYRNDGRDEVRRFLARKNTVPNASAVLLRRSAFLAAGGAPEELAYCGDWLSWARVLRHADIAYVAEPLNFFRVSHSNCVRQSAAASLDAIRESLHVIGFIKDHFTMDEEALRSSIRERQRRWRELAGHGQVPWSSHKELAARFNDVLPGSGQYLYRAMPSILAQQMICSARSALAKLRLPA